ncbi:MAG TPA: carbonic anhydrase [Pyrinomonadaceae bacterium]|nr:carbonic anhydrase [Pyrinomonadaceae bacterium]
MKNPKSNLLKFLQRVLALFLVGFLIASVFSACSSANASAKKEKTKKSKPKKDVTIEEETDSESENTNSENNTENNVNSENKNSKKVVNPNEKVSVEDSNKTKVKAEESKKEPNKKDVSKAKDSSAETEKNQTISSEETWKDLMKGNKRFMAGKHTAVNYSVSRHQLAKGQHPQAIILGCSDSRVPPEIIFDKNLGELFVIRDAGNIADEVSLGSIEYAVEHLHVKTLVILGHESCGAVAATLSGEKMPTANLRAITETIAPAFDGSLVCKIGEKINLSCVELNVQQSAKEVLMKSPIIKKAVQSGELTIFGAVYHLETGQVVRVEPKKARN